MRFECLDCMEYHAVSKKKHVLKRVTHLRHYTEFKGHSARVEPHSTRVTVFWPLELFWYEYQAEWMLSVAVACTLS